MNAMVLFFVAIIPLGDNMIKIDKTFFNTKTDRKKTNSVKHDVSPKERFRQPYPYVGCGYGLQFLLKWKRS